MAAPTTMQCMVDWLMSTGGTSILGGRGGKLTASQDLPEITSVTQQQAFTYGKRRWTMAFDSFLYEESSAHIHSSTMSCTVGGVAIKGIETITFDITHTPKEASTTTTLLDVVYLPGDVGLSVTITGKWYDFDLDATPTGGDEALEDLVDQLIITTGGSITTTPPTVDITFGAAQSFAFSGRTESFDFGGSRDEIAAYTVTVKATGAITDTTTNADSGLAAFIVALLAGPVTSAVFLMTTSTTDYTEFTGTAFPTRLSVSMTYGSDAVRVSGEVVGSGALEKDESA